MSNNQIKKKNLLIICRGAGDLATGIIHRLHRAGHRVIALETDYPAAIRRQVSFCEAVYDGSATVEGLTARLLPALNDAETISGINDTPQAHIASQKWKSSAIEAVLEAGEVPLLIDPTGESIALFRPDVVVMLEGKEISQEEEKELGDAALLQGVSRFPARVKCAGLSCQGLREAIERKN